jgi:hypothetical protein
MMMCITDLMHTIAGALDHAILIIGIASGNKALRPRLRRSVLFTPIIVKVWAYVTDQTSVADDFSGSWL